MLWQNRPEGPQQLCRMMMLRKDNSDNYRSVALMHEEREREIVEQITSLLANEFMAADKFQGLTRYSLKLY